MPMRNRFSFLKSDNLSAPYVGVVAEISVNTDTGRLSTYNGVVPGGQVHALLTDLQDPSLLNYPAGSLVANTSGVTAAPTFVTLAELRAGGAAELGTPLSGRQIGLQDEETNALSGAPLTRVALATANTERFRRWRDARRVQAFTRATATVGVYTFDVQGYGVVAFGPATCTITIGAAEPNDTTITNLVAAFNGVAGRNYTATATGTVGAKVCTLTTVAGSVTVAYASNSTVFVIDANTANAVLNLRSLKTVPFIKLAGQSSAICLSGLDTAVCRAVQGTTEIYGTRKQTRIVAIGAGTGPYATIEFIDGAQGLYLHDLELAQDDIYPWQYVTITRPLGTPGTYNLTVTGTGPGAFGPTVVPITIGAAEPNDTTIANVVAALNGVAGNNYAATVAGTAPNTYCAIINDVSSLSRYTLVSAAPTILFAAELSEQELQGLRLGNTAGATRSTRDILIERVDFRATVGAGLSARGEAGKLVEHIYLNTCTFDGANPRIGLGLGARACIELLRGVSNVYATACTGVNAKNANLEIDTTGNSLFLDYAQRNINFTDCVFSNIGGTTTRLAGLSGASVKTYTGTADPLGTQIAAVGDVYLRTAAAAPVTTYKKLSGGVDSTGWVLAPLLQTACHGQGLRFTRCRFLEGAVLAANQEQTQFIDCDFLYVGGLNASVDALMSAVPLFAADQQMVDLALLGCRVVRGPGAPTGNLWEISGSTNGAGLAYSRPSRVTIASTRALNASMSSLGVINDVDGLEIGHNVFTMNCGVMTGADTGLRMAGNGYDVLNVNVHNNLFEAIGTYQWTWAMGISFGSTALRQSSNLRFTNNTYARACSNASTAGLVVFDVSAPADALGSKHERNPILLGNDGGNIANLFVATNAAVGRVHAVVGGNVGRNCAKMIESTISPEGAVLNDGSGVIGLAGDRYTKQNGSTTTEFWRKETTTVANVPDNKGWVLEVLAASALPPVIDPLATFAIVDSYLSTPAFTSVQSGTGAALALAAGTITRGGRVQATTGTTATGRQSRSLAMSGGNALVFSATSGTYVYQMLGWSCPILSDATEQHVVRMGFSDSVVGDGTDGAWIEFDAFVNANLVCKTSSNATRTINTSTVAPTAGVDYDFKIVATNDTSVAFYYRLSSTASTGLWTLLFTHTTNIPSGTARTFSCGHALIKLAGLTARVNEYQTQAIYQVVA